MTFNPHSYLRRESKKELSISIQLIRKTYLFQWNSIRFLQVTRNLRIDGL